MLNTTKRERREEKREEKRRTSLPLSSLSAENPQNFSLFTLSLSLF
jgi:hypothetical protein